MLYYALIICKALNIYSFIIQDTYNVLLKENADYKIDLVINEEDYEIIVQNQLVNIESDNEDKFNELNKLAYKEYNETIQPKLATLNSNAEVITNSGIMLRQSTDKFYTAYAAPLTKHALSKRDINTDEEMEYDYDHLTIEYYDETVSEIQFNNTDQRTESDLSHRGIINTLKDIIMIKPGYFNCTVSDTKGIGLRAINCLWEDYTTQRRSTTDASTCLWRIIKIWFLVYLVIALPVWCTRGWCCCCLVCKFFKPRKTIEEARKYVLLNPPGAFKTKTREVYYEPTEREIECYEEFEHFLRTL